MITTDQIKAAIDRVEALNKYLNIEEKKIQLEEEELKTQAPEFWQDQKRAEAQMKLVKGLKFWIEGYNAVNAAVNEVQIAYDLPYGNTMQYVFERYHPYSNSMVTLVPDGTCCPAASDCLITFPFPLTLAGYPAFSSA